MSSANPIKNRFCIDESGNTGDAILKHAAINNFGNQPIFSLGCVGVPENEELLKEEVFRLKSKYRIQSAELKASRIYTKKPDFINEVVRFLVENEYPIFMELMDKKYYISANIVNSLIMPKWYVLLDESYLEVAKLSADLLYEYVENYVFAAFCDACLFPTDDNFVNLLRLISDEIDRNLSIPHFKELKEQFSMTVDDYEEAKSDSKNGDSDVCRQFLPIPDHNKRGEILAMLPHIPAFTNLCARINNYVSDSVDKIILTHDEQAHFDQLLKGYQIDLQDNKHTELLWNFSKNSVNFHFTKKAVFEFENSRTLVGLQVADLLAGFGMRYLSDIKKGNQESVLKNRETFYLIAGMGRKSPSLGINAVTSYAVGFKLFTQ